MYGSITKWPYRSSVKVWYMVTGKTVTFHHRFNLLRKEVQIITRLYYEHGTLVIKPFKSITLVLLHIGQVEKPVLLKSGMRNERLLFVCPGKFPDSHLDNVLIVIYL